MLNEQGHHIARRFAALNADDRRAFLATLHANNLDFAEIPIVPTARNAGLPMSYAQSRQWFLWQLNKDSTSYHVTAGLRLKGTLDRTALQNTLNMLVSRHEALRTVFRATHDGLAEQVIQPPEPVHTFFLDLSDQPRATREATAAVEAQRIARTPFDLTTGPLLRTALIRLATDEHLLLVVMHHIASDGWSMQIIVDEFSQLYRAQVSGRKPSLQELPIQYADYAAWQRSWLEAGERERHLQYWRRHLGSEHPILQLPADHPRPTHPRYHTAHHAFEVPAALAAGVQRHARDNRVTIFTVLLASFQALLHRYSGLRDIRVGVTNANRARPEAQGVVGFFVNTQVLRSEIEGRTTLLSLLDQVRAAVAGAQEHQELPFEQLVEALQPERSLNHTPLFQVMMDHQRRDGTGAGSLPGLSLQPYPIGEQQARFELTLSTAEYADGRLGGTLNYARELFEPQTIARLSEHFLHILKAIVDRPEQTVGEVALKGEIRTRQLPGGAPAVASAGESRWDSPCGRTFVPVHQSIASRAASCQNKPALHCEGRTLSHGELDRWSDRIANALLAAGVKAEARVGLCVERSVGMVAGLLGILKSGGSFVPLDPSYPAERLSFMTDDAQLHAVVTDGISSLRCARVLAACPQIRVDQLDGDLDTAPEQGPDVHIEPDQLAYVIYTSGSTGQPKGVAITHYALRLHLDDFIGHYGVTERDKLLHSSTINFDVALHELLPALMMGGQVQMRGPQLWELDSLNRTLLEQQVTFARIPTAYWQQWLRALPSDLPKLRQITVGGEALPGDALARWLQGPLRSIPVDNLYGPTETTVACLAHRCSAADSDKHTVAIGRAYPSRGARVIDADGNTVPIGGLGELCITGDTLARGYLGRPGLTAERFVPDPEGHGQRLYRSGDLCRERADGVIEYLGRLDQQVKLRGHRIELGEVEVALRGCQGVTEAVVELRGEGERKRLVGYFVGDADADDLKGVLRERLPDYMVPGAFVRLAALPLNANGKLDRKALPNPETGSGEAYEAPQGEVEQVLATVWGDLLDVERVGRHDNFFALGGDSILSLQLVARAHAAGWKITPRQIFERQTPAQLAAVAQAVSATQSTGNHRAEGSAPLLPIQARFFENQVPHRDHWNQAVLLRTREPLDEIRLERALQAVVDHHDAFRLRYVRGEGGEWQQRYAEHAGTGHLWTREAASAAEITEICAEAQRSLHVDEGPLVRAVLIEVIDGSQRLFLAAHHLIVDGVSWRILLEDLQSAYRQAGSAPSIGLQAATSGFNRWTERVNAYSGDHQEEFAYWRALADISAELPCDTPDGSNLVRDQAVVTMRLDREQTDALLEDVPSAYRTQINDVLLTALGRALSQWSGLERVLVDLEGHGREDLFDDIDLSRTVGWFTTLYPVALEARGDPGTALKRVKETLRRVPHHGLGYGAFRYLGTQEQRDALACVAPRVAFNYLGQFDNTFDEDALWLPADEAADSSLDPASERGHDFSINGRVYDGELRLNVGFSAQRYRRESVEAWVRQFEKELTALIAHCTSGARGLTPSDFPLARITQQQLDALPVPREQVEDLYPMTTMQQGLLFHSLQEPGGAYVNQWRVDIEGLDVQRFEAAWRVALERHDILRTGFLNVDGLSLQWVAKSVPSQLIEEDWIGRAGESASVSSALDARARAERECGFQYPTPPLMRLLFIRVNRNRHHLIWTRHHLLMDGWGMAQLIGEVLHHYNGGTLPPVRGRYRDYIEWLSKRDTVKAEHYWKSQLRRLQGATRLSTTTGATVGAPSYEEHIDHYDAGFSQRLNEFSRRERITINTLLQGAWALLLSRYTGQPCVAFGATTSGRPTELPGIEQLIGLFINTVPVIAELTPAELCGEWLRKLQAHNIESREHEHTPLHEIQRWSECGSEGLFDTLVVFESYPVDEALREAPNNNALRFHGMRQESQTHYPLTLVAAHAATLTLRFSARRDALAEGAVASIAGLVRRLLEELIANPQRRIGDIDLLSDAERSRVQDWGSGASTHVMRDPVHRVIERQSRTSADAVALIFEDTQLNYAELNARANRLAHRLIRLGVKPEVRVGIAQERSVDLVVSLLAVLKAGGVYVPLDPEYPAERLDYMMRDSGIALLLTHSGLARTLPQVPDIETLAVDTLDVSTEASSDPAVPLHPQNLAYVIYTSGSTGRPKGAANRHDALYNRLAWMQEAYELTPHDTVLQKTPFSFDVSVWEFFWPLMYGARLVLAAPGAHREPERLVQLIERHEVSTLHFVPSMLTAFLEHAGVERCRSLRRIVCSGEALPLEAQRKVFARLPWARLYNLYGPTEAAIDVTHWTCDDTPRNSVPIGRPIAGIRTVVLDDALNRVPAGVAGELYLGGVGLGRGYLKRSALTSERFIADPHSSHGERLYRTGDLARWNAEGQLEYLGRVDHQVKIRGFRIELGEIEAQLLAQPEVREAAVVTQGGVNGQRLVAYVVPHRDLLDTAALSLRLSRVLPDYMIPAAFMVLGGLPLNANGKLDRKALPTAGYVSETSYQPPQGEFETVLADIWREVLGVERVGRDDHFFDRGGDSLAAMRVLSLVRSRLLLSVTVRDLFEFPTISRLVEGRSDLFAGDRTREKNLQELEALLAEVEG